MANISIRLGSQARMGPGIPLLTIDAVNSTTAQGAASVTTPITMSAGVTYGLALVHVAFTDPAQLGAITEGVTYDGVPMNYVPGSYLASGQAESALFYLVNPPLGARNVVASFDTAVNAVVGVLCLDGVNQATPIGAAVTAIGNSNSTAINIDIGAGNFCLTAVAIFLGTATTTVTFNMGQQKQNDFFIGASPDRVRGAQALDWTDSGLAFHLVTTLSQVKPWTMIGVEIIQA